MSALKLRSGYLRQAYADPAEIILRAQDLLRDATYDTMVGTGLSGALVIPMLARALDKHWLIVRKPDDGSHSHLPVEGDLGARWLFVDDFISSGDTRKRVKREVRDIARRKGHTAVYAGDYTYSPPKFWPGGK